MPSLIYIFSTGGFSAFFRWSSNPGAPPAVNPSLNYHTIRMMYPTFSLVRISNKQYSLFVN